MARRDRERLASWRVQAAEGRRLLGASAALGGGRLAWRRCAVAHPSARGVRPACVHAGGAGLGVAVEVAGRGAGDGRGRSRLVVRLLARALARLGRARGRHRRVDVASCGRRSVRGAPASCRLADAAAARGASPDADAALDADAPESTALDAADAPPLALLPGCSRERQTGGGGRRRGAARAGALVGAGCGRPAYS